MRENLVNAALQRQGISPDTIRQGGANTFQANATPVTTRPAGSPQQAMADWLTFVQQNRQPSVWANVPVGTRTLARRAHDEDARAALVDEAHARAMLAEAERDARARASISASAVGVDRDRLGLAREQWNWEVEQAKLAALAAAEAGEPLTEDQLQTQLENEALTSLLTPFQRITAEIEAAKKEAAARRASQPFIRAQRDLADETRAVDELRRQIEQPRNLGWGGPAVITRGGTTTPITEAHRQELNRRTANLQAMQQDFNQRYALPQSLDAHRTVASTIETFLREPAILNTFGANTDSLTRVLNNFTTTTLGVPLVTFYNQHLERTGATQGQPKDNLSYLIESFVWPQLEDRWARENQLLRQGEQQANQELYLPLTEPAPAPYPSVPPATLPRR